MTDLVEAAGLGPGTALVVVDVQNDFADPRGSLFVTGGEAVVAATNELVAEARRLDLAVAYTQDWHPASTPHFQTEGGVWPVHCVAGTWGAELHPDLDVAGPVVRKGTGGEDGYSGFTARDVTTGEDHPTELAGELNHAGASRLVIVGLALDVCVKATALDARRLGYDTTVLTGASAAVEMAPGDAEKAMVEMRAAGAKVV